MVTGNVYQLHNGTIPIYPHPGTLGPRRQDPTPCLQNFKPRVLLMPAILPFSPIRYVISNGSPPPPSVYPTSRSHA